MEIITLNRNAFLLLDEEIEDNITYVHGRIVYDDGQILDVGLLKDQEGTFLYDKDFVYRWRIDKHRPSVYSIHDRHEIIDKEYRDELILNYKKHYLNK